MIEHVYRFRPLTRLLDKAELENQEIYFAPPEQLNDPMEGFRDIFWAGDKVLWSNLFRHYLLCLERASTLLVLLGENHPITWDMLPLFASGLGPTPSCQERQRRLIGRILDLDEVAALIAALASRKVAVRNSELSFILRHFHSVALPIINDELNAAAIERGSAGSNVETDRFKQLLHSLDEIAKAIPRIDELGAQDEALSKALYDAASHLGDQLQFIYDYNDYSEPLGSNRRFVLIDFCTEYVCRIQELVYPRWYAACFMSECKDPSIWGTYGEGHTAVCLKFKVQNNNGSPGLRIRRKIGYSNSGEIVRIVTGKLHPMIYENTPPKIDFFRMIGRLPKASIDSFWYTDRNGDTSLIAHGSHENESEWRDWYWKEFVSGITRKLIHWKSEHEYRLILDDGLLDPSQPRDRIAHYEFSDLDGIIFGIRTPFKEKKQICKIIADKCAAEERTDFKFYQAYYSPVSGLIEHAEMGLLRFKSRK